MLHTTDFPWPHEWIDEHMVKSIQRNHEGRHYQYVYIVELIDGQKQVLKVARQQEADNNLKKEMRQLQWVHGKIPAPTVIHYGCIGEYEYLLTSFVEGCSGSDYYHEPEQYSLGYLLGSGLRAIHAIPIHDCHATSLLPTKLIEMVKHTVEARTDEAIQAASEHFPDHSLEQLILFLEQHCPSDEELVFTHGDYGSGNVLIQDGSIAAFIDLGDSGVSDPYYDIYYLVKSLTVYSNRKDELDDVLKGYGISALDETKYRFQYIIDILLL